MKMEKNTLKIIIPIIIIIIFICFLVNNMNPKKYISSINSYFELKQYEKVAKYENKLKSISSHLLSKNKYNEYEEIEYKVKYSVGVTLFEKKDYYSALNNFKYISSKTPRRLKRYEY